MKIPFKPIEIEDRDIITSFTIPSNYKNCDYSFANICSWRFLYDSEFAIVNGSSADPFLDRKQNESRLYDSYRSRRPETGHRSVRSRFARTGSSALYVRRNARCQRRTRKGNSRRIFLHPRTEIISITSICVKTWQP